MSISEIPTHIASRTIDVSISPLAVEKLATHGYTAPSVDPYAIEEALITLRNAPDYNGYTRSDPQKSQVSFRFIDRSEGDDLPVVGACGSKQKSAGVARLTSQTPEEISTEVIIVATDGDQVHDEEKLNKTSMHELQHVHDILHCYSDLTTDELQTLQRVGKKTLLQYGIGIPLYAAGFVASNNPADIFLDGAATTYGNVGLAGLGSLLAIVLGRKHIFAHIESRVYRASTSEIRANKTGEKFKDFSPIIQLGQLSTANSASANN